MLFKDTINPSQPFIISSSKADSITRLILFWLPPMYLYCECILNSEFVFFFKFVFRLFALSLIHSLRYSWEISLVFFCFSVSIQIIHEKNLQIYVLCHSCKCEICSKWCKREIFSKLTIKIPLLFFCVLLLTFVLLKPWHISSLKVVFSNSIETRDATDISFNSLQSVLQRPTLAKWN